MNDSDTSSEKPEMDVKRTESEESYMDKKESSLDGIDSEINSKVLTGCTYGVLCFSNDEFS